MSGLTATCRCKPGWTRRIRSGYRSDGAKPGTIWLSATTPGTI